MYAMRKLWLSLRDFYGKSRKWGKFSVMPFTKEWLFIASIFKKLPFTQQLYLDISNAKS